MVIFLSIDRTDARSPGFIRLTLDGVKTVGSTVHSTFLHAFRGVQAILHYFLIGHDFVGRLSDQFRIIFHGHYFVVSGPARGNGSFPEKLRCDVGNIGGLAQFDVCK